jgi:hypothetical protein
MASLVPHRAPSVGRVIKKMLEINPELGHLELIGLVRQAVREQGGPGNEFAGAEIIDEEKALALARATLSLSQEA